MNMHISKCFTHQKLLPSSINPDSFMPDVSLTNITVCHTFALKRLQNRNFLVLNPASIFSNLQRQARQQQTEYGMG